jgi:hypothetical protein
LQLARLENKIDAIDQAKDDKYHIHRQSGDLTFLAILFNELLTYDELHNKS